VLYAAVPVSRPRKLQERDPKTSPELAVRAIVFMSRLFEYECRELGVSLAQYRLLLYLRHAPKRAGELAAQAAITRPSLSVLLVALEKSGFIRRQEVDGDGRGVQLELTRKGVATIERMEKRFAEVLDDAAAEADKPRLIAALSELAIDLTDQVEARVRDADPYKPATESE
jgi:DNA-binding MarR family transcriptional regulator